MKALIAGGLLTPALDRAAAEAFVAWGYVPGPGTLFRGARKLPPAWRDGVTETARVDPRALERGIYRREAVETLLRASLKTDQALLSLLMLEKWMRLFVDAPKATRAGRASASPSASS